MLIVISLLPALEKSPSADIYKSFTDAAGSEAINRMAQYREFPDDWARDEPSQFIDQVPNNRRNQRNFDWQLRVRS